MKLEFDFISVNGGVELSCYRGDKIDIVVPETYNGKKVVSIVKNAFRNDKIVESVTFPKNLKNFNSGVFSNCPNLKKITFLNENVTISKGAFRNCNNIESINYFAYKHLANTTIINILERKIQHWDSLESEELEVLEYCFKRKPSVRKDILFSDKVALISFILKQDIKVDLSDLDQYIKYHIKNEHTEIISILLTYKNDKFSKEEIEKFNEHKDMIDIGLELPTLKQLKEKFYVHIDTFYTNVKYIYITGVKCHDEDISIPYKTADDYIVKDICISGKARGIIDIKHIYVENGVEVGFNAFEYSNIKSITLPDTVLEIKQNTFYYCTKLEQVNFPNSLIEICRRAFQRCKSLEHIVFPASLECIEDFAFKDCDNLKTVTFNSKVKLGKGVFEGCPNVKIIQN